ncbi:potassium transporter 10 [Selaginella moellendorffii]|uniref:potassium transporter 10 n=1 Tax=Selaginella moellendorffii TaxID=88036 RepID=UPI000D1CB2E2|nr:potassium transporter 10 [Selaginella moellendorffii]XP_024541231.1 potassium transporter 10 [Selaginella moellendorffii]|eukprot:XP_024541228.1 potassium transporter 10 [Selaginella moellendorffii]
MAEAEDSPGKGYMWNLDRIDQPFGEEADRVHNLHTAKKLSTTTTLRLAFLSLGVVYGDLGTSPLYVFSNIFPDGIKDRNDLLGTLSLIIYTITLIALVKYVFFALRANDNGEGGTFALYSLICRHAKVNTIPNQHHTDRALTTYSFRPMSKKSTAYKLKNALETSLFLQKILLVLVLLGTSMVIGDGMLSPSISVLSAVQGIRLSHLELPKGSVLILSLLILVALFSMQRFGTAKVGFMFAPIIFIWFISIGTIGIYNIFVHYPPVFKALSPVYIFRYFRAQGVTAWISLGGVVLSVTGAEALFADLGHFTAQSIQLAFTIIVFPCLIAAYMGQAAYLMKYPRDVDEPFYNSIPNRPFIYWPMFVVATAAAIIASQATISATFSIVKQAVALGCFPRVKIVHTSHRFLGQVYVPEVNWTLMVACLLITAGFRETQQIGNAYGVAVVLVMVVTTFLLAMVMILIWHSNLYLAFSFLAVFGSLELLYFSSVLFKVTSGGWVPLAIGSVLMAVMYFWHYGSCERHKFELQNKVSLGWILQLGPSLGMVRLPGIGLFYTELAHGVPSIFSHFLTHFPAVHSILTFVCVKYLPVSTVAKEERFLLRRIGPKQFRMYRCVVRYGYKDLHKKDDHFDELLIRALAAFIRYESLMESVDEQSEETVTSNGSLESCGAAPPLQAQVDGHTITGSEICLTASSVSSIQRQTPRSLREEEDECAFLIKCKEDGIVHIMGSTVMRARQGSGFFKRQAINSGYSFLRKLCRDTSVIYHVPHESLLHVGMVYNI